MNDSARPPRMRSAKENALRAAIRAKQEELESLQDQEQETEEEEIRPQLRRSIASDERGLDHKARAAERAREIMGNVGDFDEGVDDFRLDGDLTPDGWTYEWKRELVVNSEDYTYINSLKRTGWEPVLAGRHPELMPVGTKPDEPIRRKGLVLMERPKEITDRVKQIDIRRARQQIAIKEQQIKNAPDGQFDRNNKDNSLVSVKRSYQPMAVPE